MSTAVLEVQPRLATLDVLAPTHAESRSPASDDSATGLLTTTGLDRMLTELWDELEHGRAVGCPACGGVMGGNAAGSAVEGRCTDCGATIC